MEKLISLFLGRKLKYKTHYLFENPAPGEQLLNKPPLTLCCGIKPIYVDDLGR